jgi:phage shock protein A
MTQEMIEDMQLDDGEAERQIAQYKTNFEAALKKYWNLKKTPED